MEHAPEDLKNIITALQTSNCNSYADSNNVFPPVNVTASDVNLLEKMDAMAANSDRIPDLKTSSR